MGNEWPNILWLTHLSVTLFLVGLIWMVQVVHYPLFADVGIDQFQKYWRRHTQFITWLVAPTMLTEGITAALLFFVRPAGLSPTLLTIAFVLVIVNGLSTALVQIPLHERLGQGFDTSILRRLVLTNWIRTMAWTLRGLLLLSQTQGLLQTALVAEK
ncbi:MAG: hypothetical protein ACRCZF_09775 [Gemmataceae bacterium]